jgi:uncharacterized flavoprotein (TIGR03862 family)
MNTIYPLKHIHIIGAGPSGLFCSDLLLKAGYKVSLYDQMSGVGKKFLVAGNGGLNLTHSENKDDFSSRYGENQELFRELLNEFSNDDLRRWCKDLGVETFIGTSGRVFPENMKAAQLLSNWLKRLKENPNFDLHLKTKWIGFEKEDKILFKAENEFSVNCEVTIFSLGGASWKKTGSDGLWSEEFIKNEVSLRSFSAMNCGFETRWNDFFKKSFDVFPIKNIEISINDKSSKGEVMITQYGIEGGAVYAISREVQASLGTSEKTVLFLDLFPDLSVEDIKEKINRPKGKNSFSNHLRKVLKINSNTNTLIRECLNKENYTDLEKLSKHLKKLPIFITNPRPIDEAISTSGGVLMSEVNDDFKLINMKNTYVSGEMLDWDAPTGGYLLQGCFSIANRIVSSIKKSYPIDQ